MPMQRIAVSPIGGRPVRKSLKNKSSPSKSKKSEETKETLHLDTVPNCTPDRCESSLSTMSGAAEICRICHCEEEPEAKLIGPCLCSGSMKYVHQKCLQKWIKSGDKKSCELCHFDFIMTSKVKPFRQWEKMEMTPVERRKLTCSVTFHIIAITCVIWSLYVLIDRTTEEITSGSLEWPFWTKLIVVAVGFTGGLVFMYVQCKMYVQLCKKWKTYNHIIFIECAPDDPEFRAAAAMKIAQKKEEKYCTLVENFSTTNATVHQTDSEDSPPDNGGPDESNSGGIVNTAAVQDMELV